ncbi:MAG: endonuclease V [Mucilaginibacter sp.]|uniref:endonuclease V n=1 Tax=Mucilaginibacter sp. TaxID=1882438 RepID=UPI0031A9F84B
MILAIDVYYRSNDAKAVAVLFNWDDAANQQVIVEIIDDAAEYIPGEFYKRELPCILKLLEKIDLNLVDAIIVDGYVYVDNNMQYGLGGKLWEALLEKVPIIGVAKTSFYRNKETVNELRRGESLNPLYISSIGIDVNEATRLVKAMKGNFRIPDILKNLDQITKQP